MNNNEQSIRIPFASVSPSSLSNVNNASFISLLQDIKNDALPGLQSAIQRGRKRFLIFEAEESMSLSENDYESLGVVSQQLPTSMTEPLVPGAPNVGGGGIVTADTFDKMSKTELIALLRSRNLNANKTESKKDLITRLRNPIPA
jgi:hypothetical protein